MTQLRRNTRPKCSKKRGRKGPLAEDEVEAEPPNARDRKVMECNGCRFMYQGVQAGVPEIRIVLKFTEGRDEAFQLKEAEKEVEKWQGHPHTDLL